MSIPTHRNQGFLPVDEWTNEAATAAETRIKAFFPNQGVHIPASVMARCHPLGAQYLETIPAIIPFVTMGENNLKTHADRMFVATRWGGAVHRAPKLKDLAREFGAPVQIRKILPSVVTPINFRVIYDLRMIPPSALSQAIPETAGDQKIWLSALNNLFHGYGYSRTVGKAKPDHWHWAVTRFGAYISTARRETRLKIKRSVAYVDPKIVAMNLADFFANNPSRFNANWTIEMAQRAMDQWHEDLAKVDEAKALAGKHGIGFDQDVDYAPLPETASVGGFEFVALRNARDLFREGRAMRHCVATYINTVINGGSRVYSIRHGETRIATLELVPEGKTFIIRQISGPCNARPPAYVSAAVVDFVAAAIEAITAKIAADREKPKSLDYWTGALAARQI